MTVAIVCSPPVASCYCQNQILVVAAAPMSSQGDTNEQQYWNLLKMIQIVDFRDWSAKIQTWNLNNAKSLARLLLAAISMKRQT